jgi:hypothetical protein
LRPLRMIALAPLFAAVLPAQNAFEFEARYWPADTLGHIRIEERNLGTDLDFREDLGISEANSPEFRFRYLGSRSRVLVSYTPIEITGDEVVRRTVFFAGVPYPVGARVETRMRIHQVKSSWAYQFIQTASGRFRLGPMIETNLFFIRARLTARELGMEQRGELRAPLPTAGLTLNAWPHPNVEIFAQAAGMQYGRYGYLVNSDSGIKVYPARNVFGTVGFRNFNLNVRLEPDFGRIHMRGFVFGGGVSF